MCVQYFALVCVCVGCFPGLIRWNFPIVGHIDDDDDDDIFYLILFAVYFMSSEWKVFQHLTKKKLKLLNRLFPSPIVFLYYDLSAVYSPWWVLAVKRTSNYIDTRKKG
jgi:hypothetical protein